MYYITPIITLVYYLSYIYSIESYDNLLFI